MDITNQHNARIAKMSFASVYPMYLAKVEKKGRTKKELHQVIEWLTGFDEKRLHKLIKENVTFESFFQNASLNPKAHLITGVNMWLSHRGHQKSFNSKSQVFGQIG